MVRIEKRRETFVFKSLFLNQATGKSLGPNKERTIHANAWTCCFLFSPLKITSLRLRRTNTSSSIYFFTISTFYVIYSVFVFCAIHKYVLHQFYLEYFDFCAQSSNWMLGMWVKCLRLDVTIAMLLKTAQEPINKSNSLTDNPFARSEALLIP